MKTQHIVMTAPRRAELQSHEIPDEPPPGRALVEAEYSIISPGTEGARFAGIIPKPRRPQADKPAYPRSTGYGHLGKVLAVGDGVTMCAPGDRVLSFSNHARHVMAVATRMALPVPPDGDGLRFVFARMAGVGIAGLRSSSLQAGDRALVIGLGLVGNLAAQILRLNGVDVMAADIEPFRLDKARECGLEPTVNPAENSLEETVEAWTGGAGADCVIDATGMSEVIVEAVEHVRSFGEMILLGSPRAEAVVDVTPFLGAIHLRSIRLIGALEWGWPQHPTHRVRDLEANYRRILRWIETGRLSVEPLLTSVLPPAQCQEAYTRLVDHKDEEMAVVFDWSRV